MQVKINYKQKNKFKKLNYTILNSKGILVVDAPPGSGKTESAINYINSSPKKVNFIYVTPYLSEIDRIIKLCPDKNFKQPSSEMGTKKRSFFNLISKQQNIVCTHALFDNFDSDCLDYLKSSKNKYILIMDEVADVVQKLNLSQTELNMLLNPELKLCHVEEETKQLIWDHPDCYIPRFQDVKTKAELGSVYVYSNRAFFWSFPVEIFKAFQKVFILTYKFTGQIQYAYYNFFKVDIRYIHIKSHINKDNIIDNFYFDDNIYERPEKYDVSKYKELITIYDGPLNDIGNFEHKKDKTKLSKAWHNSKSTEFLKILKNNTINYYKNIIKIDSNEFMWTTFKSYKSKIQGHGMSKNFVPCNTRASNNYIEKTTLAYLINCYLNPEIQQFFRQKGAEIDEDEYALSEMLQWIFRSRIRKKEPINIYIPSQRMRELLINWE